MSIPRRILTAAIVGACACAGSTAIAQGQEAPAPVNSSQLQDFRIELPEQVYNLTQRFDAPLPSFVSPPLPQQAKDVEQATIGHLEKAGHHRDDYAAQIAQDWADQGVKGEIEFISDVGDGHTHLDQGSGNVYRLTEQQAQERTDWLNRNVHVTHSQGTGFGTAVAADGEFIYLAEYFLK